MTRQWLYTIECAYCGATVMENELVEDGHLPLPTCDCEAPEAEEGAA